TFWTINRKRCRTTGAHQSRHLDNRACATPRARSSHRAVAKPLNKTGDVLAVETARRHDYDATFAPPVSRQKDSIVPEDVDRKSTALLNLLVILPADYFEARGESDYV